MCAGSKSLHCGRNSYFTLRFPIRLRRSKEKKSVCPVKAKQDGGVIIIVNYYLMPHHAIAGTGQPYLDIEKLKTGDTAGFHQLYQLLYNDFVLKAASLLNEKEEAPCLVNHCFIKCWLQCKALTSINYIIAFLNTTVRNNCLAYNNSNGFHSLHYSHILETILSSKMRDGLSRKELLAVLEMLPAIQLILARAVFARFYSGYMAVTDIAREMDMELEDTANSLQIAFKILHLVLSTENI